MATKQRRLENGKCLNCPNKAQSRGCCWNCIHAAYRLIRSGERTEQELIDLGAMLPTRRKGRKINQSGLLKKLAKSGK